jgi:hypothetical protein
MTWRTHSCVPRRHSCRRLANNACEQTLATLRSASRFDYGRHGALRARQARIPAE